MVIEFKTILTNLENLKIEARKDKMKLEILRLHGDENRTIGQLSFGNFTCFTLELPWLDNAQNISCIPTGEYNCRKIKSPSLGDCIEIQDVEGRSFVRVHAGNFTRQIKGCILVGDALKDIDGDGKIDIANSKNTLKAMLSLIPVDTFKLVIEE